MTASPPSPQSLPLHTLLLHSTHCVQGVAQGKSLAQTLPQVPSPARAGTQALAFEALRTLGHSQALCGLLLHKKAKAPLASLLHVALPLLRSAKAASELGRSSYDPHTVVNQAVLAAKAMVKGPASHASGHFINAVLRRFLREQEALLTQVPATPAAQHHLPAWWLARLQADWPEQWQQVLQKDNGRSPMSLRVNVAHNSVAQYQAKLAAAGMEAKVYAGASPASSAPCALILAEPCPVEKLPGFAAGAVSVQDVAAQWAAPWLTRDVRQGLPHKARILDACAAPGGKTGHLLELGAALNMAWHVTALDQDAQRLERVASNVARLRVTGEVDGVDGVGKRCTLDLKCADASQPASWWDGQPFDSILLDAPCSGSGVVRRHPDMRWLRQAADIDRLAATQLALLHALWPLLTPGGCLLYATCSVFKAEGQDTIRAFLSAQPEARLDTEVAKATGLRNGHHLTQAEHDGFFYARMTRHVA